MGTSQPPAPPSTFRTVAIVISSFAAILCLLTTPVVLIYGGQFRDIGWTTARVNGALTVGRVVPGGPADGHLQAGDTVLAWNGDRRVGRVSLNYFRSLVPLESGAWWRM